MQLPGTLDLPLRTARLVLRRFHAGDLEPLLAFHSDPEAVRYVPFEPRDRAGMASVLERKIAATELRADGDLLELAVTLAEDGPLIGDLLLALRSVKPVRWTTPCWLGSGPSAVRVGPVPSRESPPCRAC